MLSHKEVRETFTWGRNFDKDMNRLPATEWIKLKDMDSGHIQAILDGEWCNVVHIPKFCSELAWRESKEEACLRCTSSQTST